MNITIRNSLSDHQFSYIEYNVYLLLMSVSSCYLLEGLYEIYAQMCAAKANIDHHRDGLTRYKLWNNYNALLSSTISKVISS